MTSNARHFQFIETMTNNYHQNSSILFDDSFQESPNKKQDDSQILFNRSNLMKSSMIDYLKQVFSPVESSKTLGDSIFQASSIAIPATSPVLKKENDYLQKESQNLNKEQFEYINEKYVETSFNDRNESITSPINLTQTQNSPTIAYPSALQSTQKLNDSLKKIQELQQRALKEEINDLENENSPLKYKSLDLTTTNFETSPKKTSNSITEEPFSSPLLKRSTKHVGNDTPKNKLLENKETFSKADHSHKLDLDSYNEKFPKDLEEEYETVKNQRKIEERVKYGDYIANLSQDESNLLDSDDEKYEAPVYEYKPKSVSAYNQNVSYEEEIQSNKQEPTELKPIRQQISELMDDPEWEEINNLLRSNQLCGIIDDQNFSSQLKYTLKQLLEALNHNQDYDQLEIFTNNENQHKIQSQNQNIQQLKNDIDKLNQALYEKDQQYKQQLQELNILKSIKKDYIKLEKENQRLTSQSIKKDVLLSENESTIIELKKRIQTLKSEDSKAIEEAQAIYTQFVENIDGKKTQNKTGENDKIIRVIKAYENQRKQMNEQIHAQRKQIQSLNDLLNDKEKTSLLVKLNPSNELTNEEFHSSKDISGVDWMSKYRKLKSETELNTKSYTLQIEQLNSVKNNLENENKKLLQELRSLPSELDYEKLKIDFDQLKEKYDFMYKQSILKEKKVLDIHPGEWNRVLKYPNQSRSEFLLKQICEQLQITDKDLILATIKKIQTVVEAVPHMQRFITDVCQSVQNGVEILGPHSYNVTPKDVTTQINKWIGNLQYIENRQI